MRSRETVLSLELWGVALIVWVWTYKTGSRAEGPRADRADTPAPASSPLQHTHQWWAWHTQSLCYYYYKVLTGAPLLVTASPFTITVFPSVRAGHTWYMTRGAVNSESKLRRYLPERPSCERRRTSAGTDITQPPRGCRIIICIDAFYLLSYPLTFQLSLLESNWIIFTVTKKKTENIHFSSSKTKRSFTLPLTQPGQNRYASNNTDQGEQQSVFNQ